MKELLAVALSAAVLSIQTPRMVRAEWDRGDLPLDPAMHAWFMAQKSASGAVCCDEGDGAPATAWGVGDKGYWVEIYGRHFDVTPDEMDPAANKFGAPLVWTYPLGSKEPIGVRCFLRGPMG